MLTRLLLFRHPSSLTLRPSMTHGTSHIYPFHPRRKYLASSGRNGRPRSNNGSIPSLTSFWSSSRASALGDGCSGGIRSSAPFNATASWPPARAWGALFSYRAAVPNSRPAVLTVLIIDLHSFILHGLPGYFGKRREAMIVWTFTVVFTVQHR